MSIFGRLSTADKAYDFNLVTIVHDRRVVLRPLKHDAIVFDSDTPRIDIEPFQQCADRKRFGDLLEVAVQPDLQRVVLRC